MLTVVLGVAIGLVFVFLLFSLFLSAALEAVAALLMLRGRALRVAIARLIHDPARPPGSGFGLLDEARARPSGTRAPAAAQAADADAPVRLTADAVDPDAPELHKAATESLDGDHVAPRPLRFADVFSHALIAGAQAKCTPFYVPAAELHASSVPAPPRRSAAHGICPAAGVRRHLEPADRRAAAASAPRKRRRQASQDVMP